METIKISLATEFSRFPAGRFLSDGPFSGQRFREEFLIPALKSGQSVALMLDGTLGYGSSFLEEAFGGLVRLNGYTPATLHSKLSLTCSDPSIPTEIWRYIDNGAKKAAAELTY